MVEVDEYEERPAFLVYYDHSFHLMDFKIEETRTTKVGLISKKNLIAQLYLPLIF